MLCLFNSDYKLSLIKKLINIKLKNMPKSKHRKNHKKKVENFKLKSKQKIQSMNKIFQEQLNKIIKQKQITDGENGDQTIGL